jgi:hypothetical protein
MNSEKYIGLDVQQATISVAVTDRRAQTPRRAGTMSAMASGC